MATRKAAKPATTQDTPALEAPEPAKPRRKSGPSGRSRTNDERKKAGLVHVPLWLDPAEAALLAELQAAFDTTRKATIQAAIRLAHEAHFKK